MERRGRSDSASNSSLLSFSGGPRKSILKVAETYDIYEKIVRDPLELGGDGYPGFDCPKCRANDRSIDFLDPVKADTDDRYCHVAIMSPDVLDAHQAQGRHCNKTISGPALSYVSTGIPISPVVSKEMSAIFLSLTADRKYEQHKTAATPRGICPVQSAKARSLTPYDLVGIWIICLVFATIGIIVSLFERRKVIKRD